MARWPYSTAQWQRLRLTKLACSPLCEHCAEIDVITIADTVDHVVAISIGGEPFPSLEGLQSLCRRCHGAKTARSAEAGAVRTRRPRKGCTPDGKPFDPTHPWHPAQSAEKISQSCSTGTDALLQNIVSSDREGWPWA